MPVRNPEFEGTVNQYGGNGIMALFGALRAHRRAGPEQVPESHPPHAKTPPNHPPGLRFVGPLRKGYGLGIRGSPERQIPSR